MFRLGRDVGNSLPVVLVLLVGDGTTVVVVLWPPSSAISTMVAVLAIGTSVSFHGKNDTAMAQSDTQNGNATDTTTNSTG